MTRFENYRILFPSMPIEAILFFCSSNCQMSPSLKLNTVSQFCNFYRDKYGGEMPQPQVVDQLCQRLSEFGWMSPGRTGTFNCTDNEYITFVSDTSVITKNANIVAQIRCAVYGFTEVFDLFKDSVIPLVSTNVSGDKQIGSSFVLDASTIGTAWHCVENAIALSLKGISADTSFEIFRHSQEGLDIAIIRFSGTPYHSALPFILARASILDDVVILGYPNIPGYIPNIAGEKALMSSKLTALAGHIGSETFEIWSKENVFLLTSRVRGGFSGGPVLDRLGQCVGIVARDPSNSDADGVGQAYDRLGYGVAMPATSLKSLIEDPTKSVSVDSSKITLEDFV